ncbi:lasso peptide isopeptide bond-forming cyclase [Peribacillus huizhouensis]|uniref:asparagine synthase (glutamine-hydrolyzing) n=1 Tax=Peribacillus huizhouensis TaxID=1501239 RepID=A0ABR6CKR0_9BACI|nr:lasso peptide isopeptide bond-forming cyclase [Peribacillus huizhouensis]MBA9025642.1 asparagine synthase (glutamine-hydrolyzing) [Peribacillus huizhouensis]
MSAITGIYHLNEEPVNLQQGQGLMTALQKYPADDIQIWHSDKVFLGCHAQWITPESIGEQLPYYDHERQLAITVDAIIDNREELFERLQVDRNLRKTMPDSQLILLAYYKWGEESPKYLIGDYAFMIWDEKNQQLFGARDPSGYRTLYYYRNQSHFAFCTTIEPLLNLPYVDVILNEQWLSEYLAITGMIDTVDARMTPYRHIEQIPPFHSITVYKDKIKINRYGTFTSEKQLKLKSDNDYIEAFQDVFQKAVTSRLRTHHKVGSQLSGGLDSGSVVGFAARELRERKKTLHTFSYIPPSDFEDFTHKLFMPDERPFIKTTVQHVGGITDHYLDFEGKNSYSELDDLLDVMEMPYKFLENSFWLKGMFEKAEEAGIGVLLNGDRGNFTISWGSAEDYYATLLKKLKWLRLYQELNQYSKNVGGRSLRRLPEIVKIGFPIINQIMSKGAPAELPVLINSDFAERTGIFNKLKKHGIDRTGWISSPNLYEQRRVLFEDMLPWNAGNTLDSKLSLRHALWKRDPTNDLRVVRFCLSVPEEQCVQNGLDRALIRRSTEKILPEKIRLNQRVFGVQAADWVHRMIPYWNTFIDEVTQLSMDKRILEFIDGQKIKSALITVKDGARPEYFTNFDYRILMRSVIVYRFLKKFT